MAEREPDIESAVGMSRELARLAEASDWDAFQEQQQARDALLQSLFEKAPADDAARERLIEGIREILALDQQIRPILEAARDESARAVGQIRQDHAGLSAYQRTAGQR